MGLQTNDLLFSINFLYKFIQCIHKVHILGGAFRLNQYRMMKEPILGASSAIHSQTQSQSTDLH